MLEISFDNQSEYIYQILEWVPTYLLTEASLEQLCTQVQELEFLGIQHRYSPAKILANNVQSLRYHHTSLRAFSIPFYPCSLTGQD